MIFENRCTKDGETYNPENVWDEHFVRADGTECGAAGEHIGTWGVEPVDAALLGPDGFPCEGCEGTSGMPPVTDKGFCAACAARAHEDGYGEYVGLPAVPAELVGAAEAALSAHLARCDVADRRRCPVCAWGTVRCPECGMVSDEPGFDDAPKWVHGEVEGLVTVGCEGYHLPVLRAVAAEAGLV
jgi:hypothetical protein